MTTLNLQAESDVPASMKGVWFDTASKQVVQHLRLANLDMGALIETDVVVIGAGVSGLSAASAAAAAGLEVVLVERGPFAASGASGKNAGIVCMGANMHLSDLSDDSHNWLWTETTTLALDLYKQSLMSESLVSARMVGSLSLAFNSHDSASLSKEVKARKTLGLPADLLSVDEIRQKTGDRLSLEGVQSALWLPQEGRCHPWSLCAQLAQEARTAGAKLYGNASVSEIQETDGRWRLRLENGTEISAKALIRCVGPTVQPNERIYALAFAIDLPELFPIFQDAAPFTYYDFRASDGHIVCTGGPYAKAGQQDVDEEHLKKMAKRVQTWLPELSDKEPKYTWAVDLKVAPDMVPHIEKLGQNSPGSSIEGLGALGVLPGILLGRKAALDLVSTLRNR